jgi:hypothetical protein
MNTNLLLDPDDPSFVNIRVHSWLNFLSKRLLNIEVENAISESSKLSALLKDEGVRGA